MNRRRPDLDKLKPTGFENMIAKFAPRWAAQRMRARGEMQMMALAGSYVGGRRDRRETQNWQVTDGSADADTLWDLPTLRARTRDLIRNAPIASGALETMVTNIVGTGLVPRSRINRETLGLTDDQADEWEGMAESIFRQWALGDYGADITREMSFVDLQRLALRSSSESGDVFMLRRFTENDGGMIGFRWQMIEADRVSNPSNAPDDDRFRGGVEKDEQGRVVAYHITDRHPGDISSTIPKWTALPTWANDGTRQVFQMFDILRPGQTRGVPFLAPVMEAFKQIESYREAEQMAAVLGSMFTVFVKTKGGDGLGVSFPGEDPDADDLKLGRGAILSLNPDEDVTIANPGRPNEQFEPFINAILTQIGPALGMPLEVLTLRFNSSYSASRAALLQAWKKFSTKRQWLAHGFCIPSYNAVITEAIARGYLDAPGFWDDPLTRAAWLGHDWIGPAPGNIDPVKEVQAATMRIEGNLSTHDNETAELTGRDWSTDHRQLAKERRMIAANQTLPPAAPAALLPPDTTEPSQDDENDDENDDDGEPEDEQENG